MGYGKLLETIGAAVGVFNLTAPFWKGCFSVYIAITRVGTMARSASNFSLGPWLLAGVVLLVVGAVISALWFKQQQTESPVQRVEVSWTEVFDKLHGVRVGDVDVWDRANASVSALRVALSGILYQGTAPQEALTQLTQSAAQLDQLIALSDQLTPDDRKAMTESFLAIGPRLKEPLDQAENRPDVGPVIKPKLDEIRSKLDTLAQLSSGPSSSAVKRE